MMARRPYRWSGSIEALVALIARSLETKMASVAWRRLLLRPLLLCALHGPCRRRACPTPDSFLQLWAMHMSGAHLPNFFVALCFAVLKSPRISMRRSSPTPSGLWTCQSTMCLMSLRPSTFRHSRSRRISTSWRSPTRSGPYMSGEHLPDVFEALCGAAFESLRISTRRRYPPRSGPAHIRRALAWCLQGSLLCGAREVGGSQCVGCLHHTLGRAHVRRALA